jgi:bacterioferritin
VSPLRIGQTVPEQFRSDMGIEAVGRLRDGVAHMRSVGDLTSANLSERIPPTRRATSTTSRRSSG